MIDQCILDVLIEIWKNLLAGVCGQHDNMHGSPETVNKRRKKLLHLWKKLLLFTKSTQVPQWHYRLPWTLSWISIHHDSVHQRIATPSTKSYLWAWDYCTSLYIKSCKFLGRQVQVVAFRRFFLILLKKIFEEKKILYQCHHYCLAKICTILEIVV